MGLELSSRRRFHSRYLSKSISRLQFNSQGQRIGAGSLPGEINRTETWVWEDGRWRNKTRQHKSNEKQEGKQQKNKDIELKICLLEEACRWAGRRWQECGRGYSHRQGDMWRPWQLEGEDAIGDKVWELHNQELASCFDPAVALIWFPAGVVTVMWRLELNSFNEIVENILMSKIPF